MQLCPQAIAAHLKHLAAKQQRAKSRQKIEAPQCRCKNSTQNQHRALKAALTAVMTGSNLDMCTASGHLCTDRTMVWLAAIPVRASDRGCQ